MPSTASSPRLAEFPVRAGDGERDVLQPPGPAGLRHTEPPLGVVGPFRRVAQLVPCDRERAPRRPLVQVMAGRGRDCGEPCGDADARLDSRGRPHEVIAGSRDLQAGLAVGRNLGEGVLVDLEPVGRYPRLAPGESRAVPGDQVAAHLLGCQGVRGDQPLPVTRRPVPRQQQPRHRDHLLFPRADSGTCGGGHRVPAEEGPHRARRLGRGDGFQDEQPELGVQDLRDLGLARSWRPFVAQGLSEPAVIPPPPVITHRHHLSGGGAPSTRRRFP